MILTQPPAVAEIVVLQARKRPRIFRRAFTRNAGTVDRGQRIFPTRPRARKPSFDRSIIGKQPRIVRRYHVRPFGLRHQLDEPRPVLGPEPPRATTIEPIQLALAHQKHAAQYQM